MLRHVVFLFLDSYLGKLENASKERYRSLTLGYEQEWAALLETQKPSAEVISASEQVYENAEAFLPLVRQYTDLRELNAHVLNELIEKIVVHEKERDEDRNVTQQVDIHYKVHWIYLIKNHAG